MKPRLFALGVIGMAVVAFATNPAQAVTANGPYYAMPAWDQTLPANTRFIVLSNMNSAAVLDRETGLVWEQSPGTTAGSWSNALGSCVLATIGNRRGWRLPTIQELSSLVDPTASSSPTLPAGHPFSLGSGPIFLFWSATTLSANSSFAWIADFTEGDSNSIDKSIATLGLIWCVRGGQGVDPQ